MNLTSKKNNRKDILKLAKEGRELHDYLVHIAKILLEPKKNDLSEREVAHFKRDAINTLKHIDKNANKIIGHIAYDDVYKEAYTHTFKLDQYHDFNVFIKENNK